MRKVRAKKLRTEFEDTIQYLKSKEKMRGIPTYNRLWRRFKKEWRVR